VREKRKGNTKSTSSMSEKEYKRKRKGKKLHAGNVSVRKSKAGGNDWDNGGVMLAERPGGKGSDGKLLIAMHGVCRGGKVFDERNHWGGKRGRKDGFVEKPDFNGKR